MTTPANTPTGFSPDAAPKPAVWPAALVPNQLSVHPMRNVTGFTSPFTRFGQFTTLPGAAIQLSASFVALDEAEVREWRAFIASLRGSANLFYFPLVPSDEAVHPQPPFVAGLPAPEIVDEGPRIVETAPDFNGLITRGWDADEGTLLLKAGNYISYDDEYGWRQAYILVEDCYCGADGTADLVLEPAMPASAPAGAVLHLAVPSAIFTLDSDSEGAVLETPDGYPGSSFNALQAVRPDFTNL